MKKCFCCIWFFEIKFRSWLSWLLRRHWHSYTKLASEKDHLILLAFPLLDNMTDLHNLINQTRLVFSRQSLSIAWNQTGAINENDLHHTECHWAQEEHHLKKKWKYWIFEIYIFCLFALISNCPTLGAGHNTLLLCILPKDLSFSYHWIIKRIFKMESISRD